MVLDALEMARSSTRLPQLDRTSVSHSDAGSQFTSVRSRRTTRGDRRESRRSAPSATPTTTRWRRRSTGSTRPSCIHGPDAHGPWKTVDDVELATLVAGCTGTTTERLHGYLRRRATRRVRNQPSTLRSATDPARRLESNSPSLHQTQGDSVLPAPAGTSRTPPARTTPHGCAFQESSGTALDRFLAGRCLRRPRFSLHQIARSGTLLRVAGSVFTCGLCDDWAMKLSTAVARLTDVVDGLDRAVRWPETSLSAAFVFGAALDGAADLDRVDVARSWSPRHPRLCRGCHDPRTSKRWPPGCGLRTCLCRGSGARRSGRSGTTRSNTGADLDRRRWQGPVRP